MFDIYFDWPIFSWWMDLFIDCYFYWFWRLIWMPTAKTTTTRCFRTNIYITNFNERGQLHGIISLLNHLTGSYPESGRCRWLIILPISSAHNRACLFSTRQGYWLIEQCYPVEANNVLSFSFCYKSSFIFAFTHRPSTW